MRKMVLAAFIAAFIACIAVMAGCDSNGVPSPVDGDGSGKAQALVFTQPG